MTLMRMWLFEVTAGRLQSVQAPIYGIPVQEFQRETKFRPQIKLYFKERYDIAKHGDGTLQHRAEIGFRIMNRTSETITRADAVEYAREIKAEFVTNPLVWKKGKFKCTYLDLENGFDLRLLCASKSEGISTVTSVLKIVDKTFQSENFQFIENTKTYPINPGTHKVYGKFISKPRQRPTVDVRLTHAQLLIYGQLKPVNLVSVGKRLKSAIQYA
ncbi:hypothetical protein IQ243_28015 [Nostocales cyanobacterium LEGE 11386]|nr:hypothetical protein [Nostocales cyanobacterium LEGE 11386]